MLVKEVLGGSFINVCSSSIFNIQSLKALTDEIGQFRGIYSLEIYSFGTVKSKVIRVLSVFPVGSHKDGVLACSQVNLKIKIS